MTTPLTSPLITLAQIKAARALLGWTQEELAQASGLSLPAINNLERGLTSPRKETLGAIAKALTQAGIEFIDTSGVRQKTPDLSVEIIEGPDWLARYDADIISQMKSSDDAIWQFSCGERHWMTHGSTSNPGYIDHRNKVGFDEKILVPEAADYVSNQRKVYRTLPGIFFTEVSWQVYGNRTAFIIWPSRRIVLTKSLTQATAQRTLFISLWMQAKPLTDAHWAKCEKWEYGASETKK